MNTVENISLRPVRPADEELLRTLYSSSREPELAQVPWTAEQKRAFVLMQWQAQKRNNAIEHPHASHVVICREGIPVGRLYLDRSGDTFHILDVVLLPEHRNHGAGSYLLGQIMAEAGDAGKPVTVFVESVNPSLRLFQRLGFTAVERKGLQVLMKWCRPRYPSRRVS